jgi:lysophospholipase L1-like esterase
MFACRGFFFVLSTALLSRTAVSLYLLAALLVLPYAGSPAGLIPLASLGQGHNPASPPKPPEKLLFRVGSSSVYLSRFQLLTPHEDVDPAPVTTVPAPVIEVGSAELGATRDDGVAEPASTGVAKPGLPFANPAAVTVAVPLAARAPRSIEDPSGHAMDAFYGALARTEGKLAGATTRITYYGDSVIASDWITATLRRKLQTRFGDGGHGFILVADAWPGYHHDNIARFASKGWKVSRVVGPFAPDGLYGLGGVSFLAEGPGIFASVSTASSGDFGRTVSHFRVTYAEMPGGGKLSLKLDNESPRIIDTAAPETTVKFADIQSTDGPHSLEIRSMGGGNVRVFHTILERDEPGIVVDAVGIIGCRLRFLDKIDDKHWAEELQRRNPNLIAFTYGANESSDSFAYPMDQYEVTARSVIKQARDALPGSSCLLIGPMDAADKKGDGYTSRQVIPAINQIQRKLAAELGCGFFDTWQAMGGQGSMGVWVQRGLGGADLIHPTGVGAELIGNWVYTALLGGYEQYKQRPAAAASASGASAVPSSDMPGASAAPPASGVPTAPQGRGP